MDGGNSWFFLSSVCYKAVRRAFSCLPPAKKTRLACDVPPKTQQKFKCLNSYWFTCTGGRWYVHACESRILTSGPKLFASIGYHIFIPMVFRGALLAGAISTRTVKEDNRLGKLWGWAFLGWFCRDPVMRLHDRHSKGKERGRGGGGFPPRKRGRKLGWLW